VALQGTLDTFALPDVLRLLAATKKSGRLRITGDRGTGSVSVDGGEVGTIEAPHAPHVADATDALFELLRFDEGSFTFDADAVPEGGTSSGDVETLLSGAETLLAEWREIESVVPSMDAWVTLRRTLDAPSVSVAAEQWLTLVAVAGGATVRRMSDELCLAELPMSRAVRDLFELGLVDIEAQGPVSTDTPVEESTVEPTAEADAEPAVAPDTPEAGEPGPATASRSVQAAPVAQAEAPETMPTIDAAVAARPIRARRPKGGAHLAERTQPESFVPLELPGHGPAPVYAPDTAAALEAAREAAQVEDLLAAFPGLANQPGERSAEDEELVRQLAMLSPRAADAVRAAADATTEAERDAALAEADEQGEQPINRGLLLKFLSSVKS
jgi:hypothetical protein